MNLLVFETRNDMLRHKENSNYDFNYLIFDEDNPFQIRHKKHKYDLILNNFYYRHLLEIIKDNYNEFDLSSWEYLTSSCVKSENYYNKINQSELIVNMCQDDFIGQLIFNFFIKHSYVHKHNHYKIVNTLKSKKVPALILEAEIIRDETEIDDFNNFILTNEILTDFLNKNPFWKDFSPSEFNLFNAKTMKTSFNELLWNKICRYY